MKADFIDFLLDVVQQYGYLSEGVQAHYYTGGLSTQESAFSHLHNLGVIKDPSKVRVSEIKKYYKALKEDK